MIYMFITTVAALLYTSYSLFVRIFSGKVKGTEALVGNSLMAVAGFFLVIAALILAVEAIKAFKRYRGVRAKVAEAKA